MLLLSKLVFVGCLAGTCFQFCSRSLLDVTYVHGVCQIKYFVSYRIVYFLVYLIIIFCECITFLYILFHFSYCLYKQYQKAGHYRSSHSMSFRWSAENKTIISHILVKIYFLDVRKGRILYESFSK